MCRRGFTLIELLKVDEFMTRHDPVRFPVTVFNLLPS